MFRRIPKPKSLSARISLLSFLWISLLMALSAVAISWSFNRSAQRSLDNQLLAYIDILISGTLLDAQGHVYLRSDSSILATIPRYWQITVNQKPLVKSPHLKNWIEVTPAEGGDVLHLNVMDRFGTEITAVQKTIIFPGDQRVTYVFGMHKAIADAFLEEENGIFLRALIFILVPVSILLLILALFQIRLQSRPLARIQQCLERVESGESARLPHDFPTEIQPLADHVNTLLDYSEGVVERYRTFAGNLSHALKTPLSVLTAQAQQTEGKLADMVKEQTHILLSLIERNLARVKSAGTANILTARSDMGMITEKITKGFAKIYHKESEIIIPPHAYFRGDEGDCYELIGNIIENACKYAKTKIRVSVELYDMIHLVCEDDGEGIPETEYETVLKRGTRLDESKPGQGIGLPIARDIISLYGGTITLDRSILGGLRVLVTLPRGK